MRVAILDDYQNVALTSADWGRLPADAEIAVFDQHIADTDALVAALEPYDVVVMMRERTPMTADRLARLPKLRLLVTTNMRNASIDFAAAAEAGITVCGTAGVDTATVEHTWALILSMARHVPAEDAGMRAGGWQHTVGFGLEGRILGILGVGRLGRLVAGIGVAFGMEVLAWSLNLDPARAEEAGATAVTKEELFRRSDIVSVHYKLGERSIGLVGATELGWMRPTSYLVNTSRAPIVDTGALLAALHEGRIAGAALDVYDVEPLPADHPIRSAPRTVLTPHLGYVTDTEYNLWYEHVVEDIVAFAAGSPVRVLTA
ncbi:MAG TPA: D-2-hydroxyacid dehydrogenase family protein [Streptosporangiales bacterium]